MFITSFVDILSIGAVVPFLAVFSSPDQVFNHAFMQPIINMLDISSSDQLKLPLAVIFAVAAIASGIMRFISLWVQTRFIYSIGADLSCDIYRRALYQPYIVHIKRNSSEVMANVLQKSNLVMNQLFQPTLVIANSILLLMIIVVTLVIIEPMIIASILLVFGFIYFIIISLTKRHLKRYSATINREQNRAIKIVQEGLGGIRDILIDNTQEVYYESYRYTDWELRRSLANTQIISGSPKFFIETMFMVLISALALFFSNQENGFFGYIPILGVLALSAQKILPIIQHAYSSWSQIRGGQDSFQDVINQLDQAVLKHSKLKPKPILFNKKIELNNIVFRYSDNTPPVLNDLQLTINKGDYVGFVGVTGSGKSTLIDIIMGLLSPSKGNLIIDDQSIDKCNYQNWQAHIAHVPQSIFLADSSIAENIAFGVSVKDIDMQRVKNAAQKAKISKTVESWKDGYRTVVGEQGVRLSGGQRQRIGIARALYKKADVLILDEATSALDSETECLFMQEIGKMESDLTVLIVAHRLTTLRGCNKIVELDNGNIVRIGSYDEIIGI
jgi:ATP-binding cassette, subfamily B, bacterial PglK